MSTLITVIHVFVCFILILVVLLQTGKGSDMGAVFGGSSQTVFGSGGAAPFLTKLTTGAAVIFMLTSLTLAVFSGGSSTSSLMEGEREPAAVMPTTPAPIPGTQPKEAAPVQPVPTAAAPQAATEPAPATAPAAVPAPAAAPQSGQTSAK